MIDELDWVRGERPRVEAATPQARRRARQALDEAIGKRGTRRHRRSARSWLSPGNVAAAAALLVVVAVVALFLGGHTRKPAAPLAPGGPVLVFRAEPAADAGRVSPAAVSHAASLLQELISGSVGRVSVTSSGDQVVVHLGRETYIDQLPRTLSLAAVMGRLVFYDWEANALTPTGRSVASLLTTQDRSALAISEGQGNTAPGSPGAGSMPLFSAVRLAAKQPEGGTTQAGRPGAEYFAFGKARSSACAGAARDYGVPPTTTANTHCYLAGPAPNPEQLRALLPPDVAPAGAQILAVPAGTVVLEAMSTNFVQPPSLADPNVQFYVLRDRPGMLGNAITNPATGADASGQPDISFGFTPHGATTFQRLTADIAHRGDLVSSLGEALDQHFAIALGNQLVTVPSIDFRTYPDGVPGHEGANIVGGLARRSSQVALLEVRLGALPITLTLLSAG